MKITLIILFSLLIVNSACLHHGHGSHDSVKGHGKDLITRNDDLVVNDDVLNWMTINSEVKSNKDLDKDLLANEIKVHKEKEEEDN